MSPADIIDAFPDLQPAERTADGFDAGRGRPNPSAPSSSLLKDERKRLQIANAATSDAAKQIKLGDKICNVRDVTLDPSADSPSA